MSGSPDREAPVPPPPPAPPLPPPRYGNRAANAIVRFAQPFIYGSRPTSADGNRPTDRRSSLPRVGLPRSSSPLSSKSTAHKTGIPIAALDICPYKTHAILAGRDILKTVQVSGSACAEDFNLRSAIIAYASTHNTSQGAISARHKDQLAANDVKWSHGRFDSTIATAAANGQIVVYDIHRPGVELARLHEHNRQVHRVAFNPHQGALLLSGSQDATIRLWDLRDLAGDRSVMTCRSRFKYPGNNEGVRDLRWSPTNGVEFAAATDNGVIQRWDFRRDNAPILKINAHEKTCHSVDWHPDGKHLVSGGADKNVKIWDFSSTDRRMKSSLQLRAPRGVLNVRWRPACWASEGRNAGSWQCTQLATSYDHQDPRIHIWDLRRPFMPFREVDRYETAPTAMLWHSEGLLWTVGIAGMFTQTDMNFAPKVSDRRSLNVVAAAPNGQISYFSERRERRRRSLDHLSEAFLQRNNNFIISGEKLSGSQSATEGSLEEPSLLSSSVKNRHCRPPSTRSSKSLTSTPPSGGTGGPVIRLDEALQERSIFHLAQVAAYGHITGLFDIHAFRFLAHHYSLPLTTTVRRSAYSLPHNLSARFKRNATLATHAGQYREAQTWRVLSLVVEKEGRNNARIKFRHKKITSDHDDAVRQPPISIETTKPVSEISGHEQVYEAIPSKVVVPLTLEDGSNMTTPIARPMLEPSVQAEKSRNAHSLDEEDSLCLPAPAWEKRSQASQASTSSELFKLITKSVGEGATHNGSNTVDPISLPQDTQYPQGSTYPSSSLVGFPDIESTMAERRAAIENYKAQPRNLVRLDQPTRSATGLLAPRLDRHNSNESFQNVQMFSASESSSPQADSLPDSFNVSNSFESTEEPERSNPVPMVHCATKGQNHDPSDLELDSGSSATGDVFPARPSSSLLRNDSDPLFHTDLETFPSSTITSPPVLRPSHPKMPIIHTQDMDFPKAAVSDPDIESTVRNVPSSPSPPLSDSLDPPPWTFSAMLGPLVTYYTTDLSSVQLPTQLLLTLTPPNTQSIPPALVLSVLLTYHDQLSSLSLHCQAASIRKLAYPDYPDVSDHGAYGITPGGPWCTVCQKPSKGDRPRYCERCNESWAPCPVCNGEGPISVGGVMTTEIREPPGASSLWAWCQECGHGGHVGCLHVWWGDAFVSEGGCATSGCLHDCVMGTRRQEVLKTMGESKKAGIVKGDEWVVGESRAVEETRSLVAGNNAGRNGKVRGTLHRQDSPRGLGGRKASSRGGLGPRTGSGGKKVRLIAPEEEGQLRVDTGEATLDRASASAP